MVSLQVSAGANRANDREWAVIVPCWLMVVVLLSYWSYTALTAILTPPFTDPSILAGM